MEKWLERCYTSGQTSDSMETFHRYHKSEEQENEASRTLR